MMSVKRFFVVFAVVATLDASSVFAQVAAPTPKSAPPQVQVPGPYDTGPVDPNIVTIFTAPVCPVRAIGIPLAIHLFFHQYADLMDLTEEMISEAARAVMGTTKAAYQGHELEFARGWKRIPMKDAIREAVPGLGDKDFADPDRLRRELLATAHADAERKAIEQMSHGELVGALFEQHVEHTLQQPTFITQFPTAVSPLARKNDKEPELTDRFELFVAGREIANAFSELNDPQDQKERFLAQVQAKARGQEETMDYDEDYIRALEQGMPPTAGEGIGIDRLVMLFTDAPAIRDVILFPLLKPTGK